MERQTKKMAYGQICNSIGAGTKGKPDNSDKPVILQFRLNLSNLKINKKSIRNYTKRKTKNTMSKNNQMIFFILRFHYNCNIVAK